MSNPLSNCEICTKLDFLSHRVVVLHNKPVKLWVCHKCGNAYMPKPNQPTRQDTSRSTTETEEYDAYWVDHWKGHE